MKRAMEILNTGITIQDLVSRKDVVELDILHLTKEEEGKNLERVIMRMKDNSGASITGGEFTWE